MTTRDGGGETRANPVRLRSSGEKMVTCLTVHDLEHDHTRPHTTPRTHATRMREDWHTCGISISLPAFRPVRALTTRSNSTSEMSSKLPSMTLSTLTNVSSGITNASPSSLPPA